MAIIIGTSGNDSLPRLTDPSTISNDSIYGLAGNDTIDGGAGVDTMEGGVGDDAYYADSFSDVIIEGVDAGTDTVYSYASYTLSPNIENLYLVGDGAFSGFGNALNNRIWGNALNNTLWSGAGNDTISGGLGSDSYYVDSISDVIIEGVDAGIDFVYSSVNYTLSANVENLFLEGSVYYGKGNALNNRIWGNNSNNRLNGCVGNDTMLGGFGSDSLMGDAGNDSLTGGVGSDLLIGGIGADYFHFYSTSEDSDKIFDFSKVEEDKITLSGYGFGSGLTTTTGIKPGYLLSSQFVTDVGATNFNHRVIYNSSIGALFFDSDGTGASAQVQIASLSTGLALTSSDFQVF